jgi:DNA modification methylase
MNRLYYGDNLEVLRQYGRPESVDLVYLDPPFNSNATYNVLFSEQDGTQAAAQIKAFEDTWRWDQVAARAYQEIVEAGGRVSDAMQAFHTLLGPSNMLAYLAMMAPRLVELHRVLKATGSLYLHCDPTASHYLKILLDAIFGPENFRSEIIWRRSTGHNKLTKQYGPIHDTILFYSRSGDMHFTPGTRPVSRGYVREWFTQSDERGPFRTNMLTGPGVRAGHSGKPWGGFDPNTVGRHWAIPASLRGELPADAKGWTTQEVLDFLHARGFIYIPRDGEGQPKYKQYVSAGVPYQDIWAYQPYTAGALWGTEESIDEDVRWLQHDAERLGYPTQKPLGLLERIIRTSCPEGGVVLDPFCGCGTTVSAAQLLGRPWIGIDITNLAISLIRSRLRDQYGEEIRAQYDVIGEPKSLQDARVLAADDPYQFQWWALGQVGARPAELKKGADRGIDGRIVFFDDNTRKAKTIILSVKAGGVQVSHIRDLVGVLDREKAVMGVLISLEEPTRNMRQEAAEAGFYRSEWGQHPRVQLLTVGQILEGKQIDMPPRRQVDATIKRAPKAEARVAQQTGMFEGIGLDDSEAGQ